MGGATGAGAGAAVLHDALLVKSNTSPNRRPFFDRAVMGSCMVVCSKISVRPGAAGLLIGLEYSRVRYSSWMYLTSLVTTRIGVELAAVQRKLLDYVVVGL